MLLFRGFLRETGGRCVSDQPMHTAAAACKLQSKSKLPLPLPLPSAELTGRRTRELLRERCIVINAQSASQAGRVPVEYTFASILWRNFSPILSLSRTPSLSPSFLSFASLPPYLLNSTTADSGLSPWYSQ